jgi:hypothetical protein
VKSDGPVKGQVLNNITSRTEIAPDDADRKKRGNQRPISEILTRQGEQRKIILKLSNSRNYILASAGKVTN